MSKTCFRAIEELLGESLRKPENLKRPEGLPTGFSELDQYLIWGGLPKGALTLLRGSLGTGATSLWADTAAHLVQMGRWVAWVNRDVPLSPLPLRRKGFNFGHLVTIDSVESDAELFRVLQELISSTLFDLIACDLGQQKVFLREHQLRKLQVLARQSQVALVILQQTPGLADESLILKGKSPASGESLYALILNFEKRRLVIERALHRPTPHVLNLQAARSISYARFTHSALDSDNTAANSLPIAPSSEALQSSSDR